MSLHPGAMTIKFCSILFAQSRLVFNLIGMNVLMFSFFPPALIFNHILSHLACSKRQNNHVRGKTKVCYRSLGNWNGKWGNPAVYSHIYSRDFSPLVGRNTSCQHLRHKIRSFTEARRVKSKYLFHSAKLRAVCVKVPFRHYCSINANLFSASQSYSKLLCSIAKEAQHG